MKYLKMLGVAAVSAMAFMAFASTASATTLEVGGTTKNEPITITASLESGTSAELFDTDEFTQNTCTTSHVHGTTSTTTGSAVTGALSTLTFTNCTRLVTVHAPGKLEIRWTEATKGIVSSEEATVTVRVPLIGYVTCRTHTTTDIGTFTGVSSGNATLHINAVLDCGSIPSAVWEGDYEVTSPSGLGVSS
ncbi:MAG TPA: hypothetical protein VFM51_12130 [Solirubrobacterales bacterium]|nr:hypothetical protein [Solirubrobacterales bacterium]